MVLRQCYIYSIFLSLTSYLIKWHFIMVPVETLDMYMTTCIVACGIYMLFMLFLLVCFLRKFTDDEPPKCQRPIELRTVQNPYVYTSVNQESHVIQQHRTSRSNRSYSSTRNCSNLYKVQMKKVPFGGVDVSQMERLATLWLF